MANYVVVHGKHYRELLERPVYTHWANAAKEPRMKLTLGDKVDIEWLKSDARELLRRSLYPSIRAPQLRDWQDKLLGLIDGIWGSLGTALKETL